MSRPNVLFMACDDLRPLMRCYGHAHMHTPNLDRLAASGVLFERNLSQVPICMASRASFMTGRCPIRDRIYSCAPVGELMPDAPTINRHFADAGYEVLGTGKVYHYATDNHEQFGDAYFETKGRAFGRGYLNEASQRLIEKNSAEREAAGLGPEDPTNGRGPCIEVGPSEESDYPDGSSAAWAVRQLEARQGADQPFFLAAGWKKPHLPFAAPKRYWDLYDRDALPWPEYDRMPDGMPPFTADYNFGELRNYVDVPGGNEPLDRELEKTLIHGYHACVSFLDAQVGKVLDALEANGHAGNTIVVLVTDHGFQLKEHGLFCKHTAFQESYHVPMLIRAPGVTRTGGRVEGLSENLDLFPTLCELAGLDAPDALDGTSRTDWLRDPASGGKPAARTLWAAQHRGEPENTIVGFTVVTDAYRYTEWTRLSTDEILSRELFDLKADPAETRNLGDEADFESVRTELSAVVGKLHRRN